MTAATPGRRLGRYHLVEPLGGGPCGEVYRAKVVGVAGMERQLAVKRFHPPLLTQPGVSARLSQAARTAEGQKLSARDQETRAFVGDLAEPVRFGSDHLTPLLADCGYRWVRTVSFDDLALQYLGDYRRDRLFRFQRMVTCSPSVPDAPWP